MFSSKSIRITRSSSLSAIGRRFDRDLSHPFLPRPASTQPQPLRLTPPKPTSSTDNSSIPNPNRKKDSQMKLKIKKEIDMLRSTTTKTKKLTLSNKPNELTAEKEEIKCSPTNAVPITNWRDLKKSLPQAGYLYIECPIQSRASVPSRQVTLSREWVLITEPSEQSLMRVEEYEETLRKLELLGEVELFRRFLLVKVFRKWRMMTEYSQLNFKRSLMERQVQGVYRDVYLHLTALLHRVRLYRFVTSSPKNVPLEEYHEYLFVCSAPIMEEIHDYIFVACLEVIFNPIRELALTLRARAETAARLPPQQAKRPMLPMQLQEKYRRRVQRVVIGGGGERDFELLRSMQFRQSFLGFFPVLKKCLYLFNQAYVEWVRGCLLEVVGKIEARLLVWEKEKPRLGQILADVTSPHCEKYTFYSPDFAQREIGLVGYQCEIGDNKLVSFMASEQLLVSLFAQYAAYLTNNLSLRRMVDSYARTKGNDRVELQLLEEVVRSNDAYNPEEILRDFPLEAEFSARLQAAVSANFAEVLAVIQYYNLVISGFLSCREQIRSPSEVYEYLEAVKVKLLYLPRAVQVGLFALDFSPVHEYLSLQVTTMQAELYVNVPSDFKVLFASVEARMEAAYRGIRNSMWSVEELLASWAAYEAYEEYRIGQLQIDLERFKNFLQVISAKCPQHYHDCFMMQVHVKEMRDKLDIKTQIFTQRLPGRLKAFRQDIDHLKEDIWHSLYNEQAAVIALAKQSISAQDMLVRLHESEERLRGVHQKMDKLEVIGRLQVEYFIEQQLTVNTHSYFKISNDLRLLLSFTQKYVELEAAVKAIFPLRITEGHSDALLEKLRLNVTEIKEVYLLLISYETLLRQLLEKYQGWRQYLETVCEIAFLSPEEMGGVRRLKEVTMQAKGGLTFQECFTLNIHSLYEEIHQIKERKIKLGQLHLLLSDLDHLEAHPPFQVRRARRRESRGRNLKSGRSLDDTRNDLVKYEFDNFSNVYRSLGQFQNELRAMLASPHLTDYRPQVALRADRLERAARLLREISDARAQYNAIMEVELFDEEGGPGGHPEGRWLLSQEVLAFFQNYRHQRQEVRECWIKFVNGLSRRSLIDILSASDDVQGLLRSLSTKMRGLRDCVQQLVKRKRQEIHMLNLVDSSTVLAVVQYPSYYFQLFYAVKEVRRVGADVQLITLYDEVLTLKKGQNEREAALEIPGLEAKMSGELRKLLALHQSQHPIDNLLNYMSLQLPLQLVYVLDQLYFADRYLSADRSSAHLLRALEGEVRLICRNGLRQELDNTHVNYALALFDQLLASRIQLRTRVEYNPGNEVWYRNVLVFELYENMLTLRNFNTQILSSFRLVDPAALALAFPFCEKALVKVCNAMKFQESIVVEQTEVVASIAARTMSVFYKVNLAPSNVENVLAACQQLYPLFVVGFLRDLQIDLPFVFQELNRIERLNSLRTSLSKDRRLLPSIFIHCQKPQNAELSETLKLRFRTVSAVSPCPQALLCSKMLSHDLLIQRGIFLNLVFLLRAYIILLREQQRYYISFQDLGHICQQILRRLSTEPPEAASQALPYLLKDYFHAIDYPLDKLIANFVVGKNRTDFQRSPAYQLAQNIIQQGSGKEVVLGEDSTLVMRMKEYETMRKAFQKYSEVLAKQRFEPAFIERLSTLFQLSFHLENRPIAVIGASQSGKGLLLRLFREFLTETVGRGRLSWRQCDLQIFNAVLGTTITENEPIIQQFVNDGQEKDVSWIVFEGLAAEQNVSLFQHIFSRLGQDVRLRGLPVGDGALSFCELYHCRQRYLQIMHTLHSRYVSFCLESLKGIAPSYICSLNKVYLPPTALSLPALFHLKAQEFLKEVMERGQELTVRVGEALAEVGKLIVNVVEDVVIRKAKQFEWMAVVTPKSALHRVLQYFLSFFHRQPRQKIEFLFAGDDSLPLLLKLASYSLYVTLDNFVDHSSTTLLQKVVKGHYYQASQDQTRDKFLAKLCLFTPKQLVFLAVDQPGALEESVRELLPNNTVETVEMQLLYRKYLKQLVETQTGIVVTGPKEGGKTSMIRLFLHRHFNGQLVVRGSNDDAVLREVSRKLVSMGETPQQQQQPSLRKLDLCIYVQDVSALPNLTKVERYLHYVIQNGLCIEGLHLRTAPSITAIIEKRALSETLQASLWSCYVVGFHVGKEYFDRVFSAFVGSKLERNFNSKGKHSLTIAPFERAAEKYLKLVRYCGQNFRRGHRSWTYDFGIVTLKNILTQFIDRYNYEDLLSEEELLSRMNMEVLGRLLSRLQEQREIEKAQDRISGLFDAAELRAMEERALRENVMLNVNLDQESLASARVRNVVLTHSLRQLAPKMAAALRSTHCVLINKASVAFNRSAAAVALEVLKLPVREIAFCENQVKFLSQIERASQLTLKKNSVAYYYLSLQELLANPEVLFFISDYLSRQQQEDSKDCCHQCKFILQYSTHNHSLIAQYLAANILPHAYVLHYHDRPDDLAEVATRLIEERTPGGGLGREMEAAVKTGLRILDELKGFQPPKQIGGFMFSPLNTSQMILALVSNYGALLKRVQTKRSALQLSLSQLNYMFKQYKERKAVLKGLQGQESMLLTAIGIAKDQHRRRSLEYNSIKNQNLKEAIQKNELEVGRLQRERDQLMASEKIWSNIYRNAHAAISRTEFAEIKYMFLTNYSIERELFQAIAFVLGEQTDLPALKRTFSDINIMARIKDLKVPDLSEVRLRQLEARIQSISKRDKLSCGRNMVEWMKVGCRLGLYRLQRDGSIRALEGRIRRLQEENRAIREKNRMDEMQKQLVELQKKIVQKSTDLNLVHLKITTISTELEQVKKEFEELIDFETYCLQELEILQEHTKKLLNFSISESLHFTFTEMLAGEPRRKFRELVNAKLRKAFGGVVGREEGDYFQLLRELGDQENDAWLLRPKEYLSIGKKRLVGQLNCFLMQQGLPLMVLDRRSVLLQDTIKNNAIVLRLDSPNFSRERDLQRYSLIIIEAPSWSFSLHTSQGDPETPGRHRVLKQGAARMVLPGTVPLVVVVGEAGEEELMGNFKVVDLEYSVEDYYQIVWNTVGRRRAEREEDGLEGLVRVERKFMEIVYFLCKKTQNITLKSKELIRTLTAMIQVFNRLRSQARPPALRYLPADPNDPDVKLARVLSKIIDLMVTFFPSQEHTSFFFRDLLSTCFDYIEMQGVRDTQSIINLIMELLTEGFKDKFPFLYLYYTRIYAVEEGMATPIQSLNLTALPDPRELISDALRDAERDPSNFFKYLPFKNIELEKVYMKLSRAHIRNQTEAARMIDGEKTLSVFGRLALKRALAGKAFEVEVGRMMREFQDRITLKNKMFLRRYVVKQRLFCVCDAGFWVSKLKFTDEFRLVQLSDLPKETTGTVGGRSETWAVFDDLEEGPEKAAALRALVGVGVERVSVVLFSRQFLREQVREEFKFLPFQHLLNIFEIKELTKVSRSKYSHIFNKVIYFKTELLRRKPFNQRISLSFLFEKIREQIMNKEDYSVDQIVLHFEWDFFLWDSAFQTNHLTLHYILSALDANPDLINEFVADDRLHDRITAVLARSRSIRVDEPDLCRLANQLRDSASRLDLRPGSHPDTDIFYLEFEYKKQQLVKQMEGIRRIAEIHLGRVELSAEVVGELQGLLRGFDYDRFSQVLVRLIAWRRLEQQGRTLLNVGLISSQFNFYLLFQQSLYIYYEMPAIDLEALPEDTHSGEDLPSPPETRTNLEREPSREAKESNRQGRQSIREWKESIRDARGSLKDNKQGTSSGTMKRNSRPQFSQAEGHSRDGRKQPKSLSMVKRLIAKSHRCSIVDPSMTQDVGQRSEEEVAQQYFKNSLYAIENRVVGLKRLGIKEQKSLGSVTPRTLDLPNGFSLRIIELTHLLSNSKNNESSRFKIITTKP